MKVCEEGGVIGGESWRCGRNLASWRLEMKKIKYNESYYGNESVTINV